MERTVWVDAWQLQCCGEPFAVGSRVSWTLAPSPRDGITALLGGGVTVDAVEDHHGGVPDGTSATAGKVTGIRVVYRPLGAGGEDPALIRSVERADGHEHAGLFLAGYLVRLRT